MDEGAIVAELRAAIRDAVRTIGLDAFAEVWITSGHADPEVERAFLESVADAFERRLARADFTLLAATPLVN